MPDAIRVLIVDDDATSRELIARGLREYGCVAATANSAEEAMRRIASGVAFDVLVTEIVMPGMDGLELRRRAKAARPGQAVVLMSSRTDGIARAAHAGLFTLQKPFTRFRLVCELNAAIGRKSDFAGRRVSNHGG